MASDMALFFQLAEFRALRSAPWLGDRTTRMKGTARRRIKRRWNVAGKDDSFVRGTRVDYGHGGDERLGIGMFWQAADGFSVAGFDNPAEIHH